MKFLMDQNFAPQIAKGFKGFGKEVSHVKDKGWDRLEDIELFKKIKDEWILITRDKKMGRRKLEILAMKENNISVFFITIQKDLWSMIELLVKRWKSIEDIVNNEKTPFRYRITERGNPKKITGK